MTDFSQWWWGSGTAPGNPDGPNNGGGGGDQGDPIAESLRFGAGRVLTRTAAVMQTSWTASWWFKYAVEGAVSSERIMCAGGSAYFSIFEVSTPSHQLFWTPTFSPASFGPSLRDPSGWYHVVLQSTATGSTVWLNGEQVGTAASAGTQNLFEVIGSNTNPNNFEGYMADWYVIDGQALDPTTFGRRNANDIWVPVTPEFEDADWGANGFHLTFDPTQDPDPQVAIGIDSSPNDNHFTSSGFFTGPPGVFSDDLVSSSGGFQGHAPATGMFDGDLNVSCQTSAQGATVTWTPSTPINFNSTVEMYTTGDSTSGASVNGGDPVTRVPSGFGWVTIASGGGTINEVVFGGPNATPGNFGGTVRAIRLDGTTILVDNTGEDYDLMQDSPSQNYATLNPLIRPGFAANGNSNTQATLSNANLTATGVTNNLPDLAQATQTQDSIYFEVGPCPTGTSDWPVIAGFEINPTTGSGDASNLIWVNSLGRIQVQGQQANSAFPTWDWATTVVAVRWTASTTTLGISVDGGTGWTDVDVSTITSATPDIRNLAWGMAVHQGNSNVMSINYGQRPFVHPVPEGFVRAQTQNLPEATIPNGRDHFRAITGPGQGADNDVAGQLAGNWSSMVTNPNGWGTGGSALASWFDGSLTSAALSNGNGPVTFTPDGGIAYTTRVRMMFNGIGDGSYRLTYNGGAEISVPGANDTMGTWFVLDDEAGTFESIVITRTNNPVSLVAIEIDDELLVDANILAIAQQTFPNGLWWIKDRVNSNQHQLVDSVRGATVAFSCPGNPGNGGREVNYTAPTGSSVAWCWNLLPDRSNGFDIVEFTGTGTTLNVPHNLGAIPEFIITARRNTGVDQHRPVYHTSLDTTKTMFLDLSSDGSTSTSVYYRETPTTTQFTVGSATNINASGEQMISYLWRSVPGYSAFGSYTGNGDGSSPDANGPFIYTGMRVAFLLIKRTDDANGGEWSIYDTTRSPNNPNRQVLVANNAEDEFTIDGLDFLSNGFKVRAGSGTWVNQPGGNYVYAAFAEVPQGGSNTAPANAR